MTESANMSSDSQFDIAIVGGGLAGVSMGLALRDYFGRVAVIDANAWSSESDLEQTAGTDTRNIVIANSSAHIFEGLGIWHEIAGKATAVQTIHVSEKGSFGVTRIRSEEENLEALGWVLAYSVLYESLQKALRQAETVSLMTSTKVETINTANDCVSLRVSREGGPAEISASLVILADGGTSLLKQVGFELKERDYRQTAVVANIETEIERPNVAYERFTQHGPLAVLPRANRHYGIVWVHPHTRAEQIMNWDEHRFIRELQADFGQRLGAIRKLSNQAACYPLGLRYAENMVKGRVLILGNAAHTLHPVAGQGFNLTLRDIVSLAEHLFANAPVADGIKTLNEWQKQRLGDIKRVIGLTDLIARGFTLPLLSPLRSIALFGLDLCPPIRRAIVRRSLGLSPPLSRLASGLPLAAP